MSIDINEHDIEFPYYFICHTCATNKGGKWPDGHSATVSLVSCRYCNDANRKSTEFIAPYIDYDWTFLKTEHLRD